MSSNEQEVIQYTINPGDSLWALADQYDTTIEEIMAANPGMDPNSMQVGQVIAIPDPPPYRRGRRYGYRPYAYPYEPYYQQPYYNQPVYPYSYPYPYTYPYRPRYPYRRR